MDNITYRRKRQQKSDLNLSSVSDNINTLSSTSTNSSIRSLPSQMNFDTSLVVDLKRQIQELKNEIEIANEEICNLNLEIRSLNLEIKEKDKKLDILQKICGECKAVPATPLREKRIRTPKTNTKTCISTFSTPLRSITKSKIDINTPINTPSPSISCSTPAKTDNLILQQNKRKKNSSINLLPIPIDGENSHTPLLQHKDQQNTLTLPRNNLMKKHKVFIFGDEQVRGLSLKMIESRTNTWNDKYTIISTVKPGATCIEILKGCDNISSRIEKDDIIILGLGTNDKNAFTMYSSICNTLYKFKNNKFFLLNVKNNQFLDVRLLNYQLKNLCKNYENCMFLDIYNYEYYLNLKNRNIDDKYINATIFKLNIEIDNIEYKNTYINDHQVLKRHINNVKKYYNNISNNKAKNSLYKEDLNKKGTIPYYFKVKEKSIQQNFFR